MPIERSVPGTWFIGLGSNLGDSLAILKHALASLSAHPAITRLVSSSVWKSAPVGAEGPDFLNAVARLQSSLAPLDMLDLAQSLEASAGRTRPYPNAPRSLDIDLLLLDDRIISLPSLTLPHPRMHERAFVLAPLVEIAPDCLIPGHGLAADCLALCSKQRIEQLALGSLH